VLSVPDTEDVSGLPVVIGIILALVIATIVTIVALPKHYGDVYEGL